MGDDTEIWSYTKVINLENYDQSQLLECLRNVLDASWLYLRSQESVIMELPAFKKLRLPNIESRKLLVDKLALLADKLDTHHRNYNITAIVGASAGILAGIAAITGLVPLIVFGPLLVVAAAIATAGGVTATDGGAGCLVAEEIIGRVELGKINKLLKEDKAYFERVLRFVQRTLELKAAVEELMNFNVFQNMMKSFGNNPDVVNAIREERPMQKLPQGTKDFINGLPICVNQKQQMTQILLDIMRSREVARVFRVVDTSFDAGNAMINLVKTAKPDARMAAAFGVPSAIAVAIDVVVLVSTSKDMAKGSRSEIAGKLRNAAELLQHELNTLQKIYVSMKNCLTDSNGTNSKKNCY